jgi:DNA-directed RNA polymerase subunit E'/Rpb7
MLRKLLILLITEPKNNKAWLTSETWKQIKERKNIKLRMINTKSIRLQEQMKTALLKIMPEGG